MNDTVHTMPCVPPYAPNAAAHRPKEEFRTMGECSCGPVQNAQSKSKSKILVVDDEASVEKLLRRKLTADGYECRGSRNGLEALELLCYQKFDALISDLRMPGMDGLELLRSVRRRDPHLAFIMTTGTDDVRLGVQAMKDGADDYLQKPLDLEVMAATLHHALEKKKQERDREKYRSGLEKLVEERTKQLTIAMRRIELSYDGTLQALAATLDLRDDGTAGHSRRVMAYAAEITRVMKCSPEQMKVLSQGALLHDIGKIGIPDMILRKPGPLTETERALMETHVRVGYNLLSRIAFMAEPAEIVLTHHERFDGKGYPQSLMGSEIPLGSRIFAVADTLDAITSDRPYRKARSYAAAREEIAAESGQQFDPEVVSAFVGIDEARWDALRHEKTTRTAAWAGDPLSKLLRIAAAM